jgi:hypothetical protein
MNVGEDYWRIWRNTDKDNLSSIHTSFAGR